MKKRYKLRPFKLYNDQEYTWESVTDYEIEDALKQVDGTPISIRSALKMFNRDAWAFLDRNMEAECATILNIGFMKYAKLKGYRVDVFPDIIKCPLV